MLARNTTRVDFHVVLPQAALNVTTRVGVHRRGRNAYPPPTPPWRQRGWVGSRRRTRSRAQPSGGIEGCGTEASVESTPMAPSSSEWDRSSDSQGPLRCRSP